MKSIIYTKDKPSPKAEVVRSNRAGCTKYFNRLEYFWLYDLGDIHTQIMYSHVDHAGDGAENRYNANKVKVRTELILMKKAALK